MSNLEENIYDSDYEKYIVDDKELKNIMEYIEQLSDNEDELEDIESLEDEIDENVDEEIKDDYFKDVNIQELEDVIEQINQLDNMVKKYYPSLFFSEKYKLLEQSFASEDEFTNRDYKYVLFYNFIIDSLLKLVSDEKLNDEIIDSQLTHILKTKINYNLFKLIVTHLINKNYLQKPLNIKSKIELLNNYMINKFYTEEEDLNIIYRLTKIFKKTGKINNELKRKVDRLYNYYKDNTILTVLNKEYYIKKCNNNNKIDNKYIDMVIPYLPFFEEINSLYDNCFILNIFNKYIEKEVKDSSKELRENVVIGQNLQNLKKLLIYNLEENLKQLNYPIKNSLELSHIENQFLNTIKYNMNQTKKQYKNLSEIQILNNYLLALEYSVNKNINKLENVISKGIITTEFGKFLLNIDDEDTYSLLNNLLKYLKTQYRDRLKIFSLIKTLSIDPTRTNLFNIEVLNYYLKAIIYAINKNKKLFDLIETSELSLNENFKQKLIDIYNGKIDDINYDSKNLDSLFNEAINIVQIKEDILKDPYDSNLIKRKLRAISSIVNEEKSDIELTNNCINLHKNKKWIDLPKGFTYFISHPKFYNKENMFRNKDSSIVYYGKRLGNIKIKKGFFDTARTDIYEPTNEFWKLFCDLNYSDSNNKCNYSGMLFTLTSKGGNYQKFIHGIYNPYTNQYKIFDKEYYKLECEWFNNYNNSAAGIIQNFLNYKISSFENDFTLIRENIIDKLKYIYMPQTKDDLLHDEHLHSIKDEYIPEKDIDQAIYKAKELENIIYTISNNSFFEYLLYYKLIESFFYDKSPLYDISTYARYLIYYYPDLKNIFEMKFSDKNYLENLIKRLFPQLNVLNKNNFNLFYKYIIDYLKYEIDIEALNIYKSLIDIESKLSINNKFKKDFLNIQINRFIINNQLQYYYDKLDKKCGDENTLLKLHITDVNGELQCVTQQNFRKLLEAKLIKEQDINFVTNYFTKRMESLINFIIKLYNDSSSKVGKNKLENIVDLTQEMDYLFNEVENRMNIKIPFSKKKEIVDKLNKYYSYVKETDNFTKDILTLLKEKQEDYIQKYINDLDLRLQKYKNLSNINQDELKRLFDNDYESRLDDFKEILDTLHFKYQNTIYKSLQQKDNSENPQMDYFVVEFISQQLDEIIKHRLNNMDYDILTGVLTQIEDYGELNKEDKIKIKNIENNRCYICDKLIKDSKKHFEKQIQYKNINEIMKLKFCSVDCLTQYKDKIEGDKPYHKKNRGVKSMTQFLSDKCIDRMITLPTSNKQDLIELMINKNLEKFIGLNLSKKQMYDLIISLDDWVPDIDNKDIKECLESIAAVYEKDISNLKKTNGKYNYLELWQELINDSYIKLKDKIRSKIEYKYEDALLDLTKIK